MTRFAFPVDSRSSRLFSSFFLGGFESSTPINARHIRVDELALTEHDRHVHADYRRLRSCGILAARDGVRWNLVDRRGKLDFSSVLPFLEAAEREGITVIWDLFHYGYPGDLHPFDDRFLDRFRAYCRAFATLLIAREHGAVGTRFYTPVNEISFFAWAGGEVGWFAPHLVGRGAELKRRLAQAAILGIEAIREVDPAARFVNCDPLVRVCAPADAPWLEEEAAFFNERYVCEAWDMLAGRIAPELGGSPAHLDILGINYYGCNQWEHQRCDSFLAEDDPRRVPFATLLHDIYRRYQAPIIVTETSSTGPERPRWLERITQECLSAMALGVDLHGICLYPILGMHDWHDAGYHPMGLWDCPVGGARLIHQPTLAVLRHYQRALQDPAARMRIPCSPFRRSIAPLP